MLTTLATVKARLRLDDSDVRDDSLLTNFIAWTSARFENDCNRTFTLGSYSDEFQGDETELRPRALPIISITSISLKSSETDGFILQTNLDYVIRQACVVSLRATLGRSSDVLKLAYNGGYIMPVTLPDLPHVLPGATALLPDDLQFAAVEQIAYLYQNKDRLGIVSLSGEGGSIAQFSKLDLLPTVQSTLAKYERWMP